MSDRSKNVTVFIFLFVIFIILVFVILLFSMNFWNSHKNESTESKAKTLACGSMYYQIVPDSVKYSQGNLEFQIDNRAGDPFDTLIIYGANETKEVNTSILRTIQKMSVKTKITLNRKFSTSVKGCEETKKEFPLG
jgi:hypothetical protein